MNFWLCVASDYQYVHVMLCQQDAITDTLTIDKHDSNKQLLSTINTLLQKHNITIHNLSHIGVTIGPGPYTSLRIAITTVNGLAYATHIKLVAIDGLIALLEEYHRQGTTIALCNAFNQELFYGIYQHEKPLAIGYDALESLRLKLTSMQLTKPITIVGNGVILYKDIITTIFPDAYIPHPIPDYASQGALVRQGWQKWTAQTNISHWLFPTYVKDLTYKQLSV